MSSFDPNRDHEEGRILRWCRRGETDSVWETSSRTIDIGGSVIGPMKLDSDGGLRYAGTSNLPVPYRVVGHWSLIS